MPTLAVEGVGHHYGRLLLFRRLSFTLEGGETLAIRGANGAGKSTLLRILAGVLTPRAGTVSLSIEGEVVSSERHPLHTGLVAPALGLYQQLTARENLEFLVRARRLARGDARIEAVLDRVGLLERADEQVSTYSSGMQQRVKFAAALLTDPPLLLLDEPSANLDPEGRKMVTSIVEAQTDRGRLLVVATNRADEAKRHDRQLRIEDHR